MLKMTRVAARPTFAHMIIMALFRAEGRALSREGIRTRVLQQFEPEDTRGFNHALNRAVRIGRVCSGQDGLYRLSCDALRTVRDDLQERVRRACEDDRRACEDDMHQLFI